MPDGTEWHELSEASQRIWEENASFWDERMGEGNRFHLLLVTPSVERLLGLEIGERVLDIACGNGNFSRRLAALGARVTAIDASPTFIEHARARAVGDGEPITYAVLDVSDGDALRSLGTGAFDAAICNMAIMDIAVIEPLLGALRETLTPQGRFVFSLVHPCFNTLGVTKFVEEEDREGELVVTYGTKMVGYAMPKSRRGLGMVGQPEPHYYFHRPLNLLFGACFRAGFVIDGLEEPTFPPGLPASRGTSWELFTEIPPVLVVRLRLP